MGLDYLDCEGKTIRIKLDVIEAVDTTAGPYLRVDAAGVKETFLIPFAPDAISLFNFPDPKRPQPGSNASDIMDWRSEFQKADEDVMDAFSQLQAAMHDRFTEYEIAKKKDILERRLRRRDEILDKVRRVITDAEQKDPGAEWTLCEDGEWAFNLQQKMAAKKKPERKKRGKPKFEVKPEFKVTGHTMTEVAAALKEGRFRTMEEVVKAAFGGKLEERIKEAVSVEIFYDIRNRTRRWICPICNHGHNDMIHTPDYVASLMGRMATGNARLICPKCHSSHTIGKVIT